MKAYLQNFLNFGTEHEVLTVRDMNWLGKKNGELLQLTIEIILKHSLPQIETSHINKI